MKKIFTIFALCSILTVTEVFADMSFSDLSEEHWSYQVVQTLVNAGRINGYPDGTFQPENQVTRWEFAKMAGGNPDTVTEPDRAATRDEAAEYLWEMAGSPEADAPSVVTDKSANSTAVAWCYTYGIMQGDDGLNLRLDSTLSRAEAVAMIVRAEQDNLTEVNFRDSVKSVILERIWNGMQTGIPYDENAVISNGQIARIALKISSELSDINYSSLITQPGFSGEYAKDIMLVCQECLGSDRAMASFMNSPVTMQDAVAVLSFYTMRQASGSLKFSGQGNYSDASLETQMGKMALQFAHYNGIRLYSTDKLNADSEATIKDIACILLQLDEIVGLNKSKGNVHATPMFKQEYPYPYNATDYPYILKEVPASVYEVAISDKNKPIDSYDYTCNFASTLVDFLTRLSYTMPSSVKAEWTFYPSLAVRCENEVIIRVGLKLLENPEGLSLNEILTQNTFNETYTGDNFFVDITTGIPVIDITISTDRYNAIRAFAGRE